jgi:predicted Rossmann fold flavoprotein
MRKVAVIGGGAAGFFAAIRAAELGAQVVLIERTSKTLAKVRISGGGRCNLTHNCTNPKDLALHYPRGGAFLESPFGQFGQPETLEWFANHGVYTKIEPDGRMFPISDSSETVALCLEHTARELGVDVRLSIAITAIEAKEKGGFVLRTGYGDLETDSVIVATGGNPKLDNFNWLARLGLQIVEPVPSLFTFNIPDIPDLTAMSGLSVPLAAIRLPVLNETRSGPLLVTHWGLSGPAILKISACRARELADLDYQTQVQVNWLSQKPSTLLKTLKALREANPRKRLTNLSVPGVPNRLGLYALQRAGLPGTLTTSEAGNRHLEQWADALCQDRYFILGRTAFKEEFVTAGGVALSEIDPATMQAHKIPGLFFCGEVLDIDGVTGGFNFQAAWTTGYIAGSSA